MPNSPLIKFTICSMIDGLCAGWGVTVGTCTVGDTAAISTDGSAVIVGVSIALIEGSTVGVVVGGFR